jgi:hypothetical protein
MQVDSYLKTATMGFYMIYDWCFVVGIRENSLVRERICLYGYKV